MWEAKNEIMSYSKRLTLVSPEVSPGQYKHATYQRKRCQSALFHR